MTRSSPGILVFRQSVSVGLGGAAEERPHFFHRRLEPFQPFRRAELQAAACLVAAVGGVAPGGVLRSSLTHGASFRRTLLVCSRIELFERLDVLEIAGPSHPFLHFDQATPRNRADGRGFKRHFRRALVDLVEVEGLPTEEIDFQPGVSWTTVKRPRAPLSRIHSSRTPASADCSAGTGARGP